MRVCGLASDLTLQFAKTSGVDRGKRRASGRERLRIGDAARGAKDAQELVALSAKAAEHAHLLQNHRPGNNGEEKKQSQNSTCDPSGVRQDAS